MCVGGGGVGWLEVEVGGGKYLQRGYVVFYM